MAAAQMSEEHGEARRPCQLLRAKRRCRCQRALSNSVGVRQPGKRRISPVSPRIFAAVRKPNPFDRAVTEVPLAAVGS